MAGVFDWFMGDKQFSIISGVFAFRSFKFLRKEDEVFLYVVNIHIIEALHQ